MQVLYGIVPHHLSEWEDHTTNIENALKKLLKEGIVTRESRVIAITDLIKNNLEVPAMEIITVGDFI